MKPLSIVIWFQRAYYFEAAELVIVLSKKQVLVKPPGRCGTLSSENRATRLSKRSTNPALTVGHRTRLRA